MEFVTDLLGANHWIVAVVNAITLVGGLVLLWKALKAIARFVSNAYHTSIKVAVRRVRELFEQEAELCARDVPFFLSRLTLYGLVLFVSLTGLIVTAVMSLNPHTAGAWRLPAWSFKVVGTYWILTITVFANRTVDLASNVTRLRWESLNESDRPGEE